MTRLSPDFTSGEIRYSLQPYVLRARGEKEGPGAAGR